MKCYRATGNEPGTSFRRVTFSQKKFFSCNKCMYNIRMYKEKLRESFKVYDEIVLKCFCGIFIGAIVALCEVVFGKGLEWILNFREHMGCIMLVGLPFAGLAIVFLFDHWGRISRKGMGLVFEVDQGKSDWIPLRMAPFMVVSTWITHFFGGSAGREGVAMQIGATVSHYFGKYFRFKNSGVIFMVAGMAAGFAGLFGTPITAIFFALEVLVAGTLKYRAMSCAIPASFTAAYVSGLFGLHKSTFKIGSVSDLDVELSIKLLVLGILFGLIGGLFAYSLKHTKAFVTNKIKNPYKRIFMMGILVAILLFVFGKCRYSGVGENLIVGSFTLEKIYSYDWILKFVLTILTLSAGFQGGEVTPLFAIGSSLGVIIAPVFGLNPLFVAALGYCSVFGAATNTFLAPIAIGMEVFGYQYFPFFFVVCAIAYIVNQNESIYALQRQVRE